MLSSLTLKNFRCFENFTIAPLERVNLIGGKNNVGKTSLLEAVFIFMQPGDPSTLIKAGRLRYNSGNIQVIKGYFFNQDTNNEIEIKSVEQSKHQYILKISCGYDDIVPLSNNQDIEKYTFLNSEKQYNTLFFDFFENEASIDEKQKAKISFASDGTFKAGEGFWYKKYTLVRLLSTRISSSQEDVEYYSNLERMGRQEEVLEALRLLEPRLKRLSLLVVKGEPIIYGDIGMSELVPLPLMGEGIGRLLSIVLAIANAKSGAVLIDEIENGVHYSALVNVWKAIADAARRADVQIFATSHSRECILAAHEAFKNSDNYDFRYHRLDRVKDEIKAFTYDQEALETSDDLNWEIR
jgi:AAA15 family ATPase/GTPase